MGKPFQPTKRNDNNYEKSLPNNSDCPCNRGLSC